MHLLMYIHSGRVVNTGHSVLTGWSLP